MDTPRFTLVSDPTPAADISSEKPSVALRILFWCALLAYLGSFALPSAGKSSDFLYGWMCAWISLEFGVNFTHDGVKCLLFLLPGLANIAILVYLPLYFLRRAPRTRFALALFVLVLCIPVSFWTVSQRGIGPLIGFFVWVAAMAAMLAPEIIALAGQRNS